jgi:hypothetical protein
MTHILDDNEYIHYMDLIKENNELLQWKKSVLQSACKYIKGGLYKEEYICSRLEADSRGVCDHCPLAWIFPECPLGKEKYFSK